MIYDGIRGNVCEVSPDVLPNMCIKRKGKPTILNFSTKCVHKNKGKNKLNGSSICI